VQTYAVSGLGPVLTWLTPDGTIAGFTLHSTRQAGLECPARSARRSRRYMLYLTKSDFPGTSSLWRGAPGHDGDDASRRSRRPSARVFDDYVTPPSRRRHQLTLKCRSEDLNDRKLREWRRYST
jgi:hypothetical protein